MLLPINVEPAGLELIPIHLLKIITVRRVVKVVLAALQGFIIWIIF